MLNIKILAVDTASISCSVALIGPDNLYSEMTLVRKQTHSKHLLEMIDAVLRMAGVKPDQIDAFAVCRGPGSFTGLRIGISVIKGLALAVNKPVIGISGLKALANYFSFFKGLICPMIDARRQEVYTAGYNFIDDDLQEVRPEQALSAQSAAKIKEPSLFCGNGAMLYKAIILETAGPLALFASKDQQWINATMIARLALKELSKNNYTQNLVPLYLRKAGG